MVIAIPISIMVISGVFSFLTADRTLMQISNCTHYSSIVMKGDTDLRLPVHFYLVFRP